MDRVRYLLAGALPLLFFAQMPTTTNYSLNDYGFGNGGSSGSSTSNYSLEGIAGEISGEDMDTSNYTNRPGLISTQLANVGTPTLSNPSNWYNKLHFVVGPAGNPSDAEFALAISWDNWVTTYYIQSDNTVGAALGLEDYQTYASWGGSGGGDVIGLTPGTTYKIKQKATRGQFTENGFGPEATAATVDPSLTFDIDVSASDTETAAPYAVAFGDLPSGSVVDSPVFVWFDLETNALSGGRVFIVSTNAGLYSVATNYTITSASGDLGSLNEGVGAQGVSATQSSGGPMAIDAPYNGSTHNIGLVDTQYRSMFSTSAAVTAGRMSFLMKAKSASMTPTGIDYADVLTAVATAAF